MAEGLNLGLSKMAEATDTHDYFQLSRLSRWHVESDTMTRALAMVIESQSALPGPALLVPKVTFLLCTSRDISNRLQQRV